MLESDWTESVHSFSVLGVAITRTFSGVGKSTGRRASLFVGSM